MKLFETIYVYVYGACKFCSYWYVRIFPPVAFAFVILLAIAAENGLKQAPLTLGDAMAILAIILILILMSSLWVILHLIEKLENCRPPRHYRKDMTNETK